MNAYTVTPYTVASSIPTLPVDTYPDRIASAVIGLRAGTTSASEAAYLLLEVLGAYERMDAEIQSLRQELREARGIWQSTPMQQAQAQHSIDPAHEAWMRSLDGWATSPEGTAELSAMEARWEAEEMSRAAREWDGAIEF